MDFLHFLRQHEKTVNIATIAELGKKKTIKIKGIIIFKNQIDIILEIHAMLSFSHKGCIQKIHFLFAQLC